MIRCIALVLLLALTACGPPKPSELQAGTAVSRLPSPLGIGTMGYSPLGAQRSATPFAELFPGTTQLHGHPQIKTVILSRGPAFELVLVRLDLVITVQELRRSVVVELEERTGRSDFDNNLVLAANHTHSGPGRYLVRGGLFDILSDHFHAEQYERLVDAIADNVEAAYADLSPARLATRVLEAPGANNDRRCEDGQDFTDPTMPAIFVEKDGQVDTVLFAYAVHPTVLGLGDLNLSSDLAGPSEEQVEDRFDHPVTAVFINSWAGDMSPGSPDVATETSSPQPNQYDRMYAIGHVLADAIEAAVPDLSFSDEPELLVATHRVPIGFDEVGYSEFNDYPYEEGGVFCGSNSDSDCDLATVVSDLHLSCLPLTADSAAPDRVVLTAGQIGDLPFVTFPGEAVTTIATVLRSEAAEQLGLGELFYIGYAQGHFGYGLLEDDWVQGGYEPTMTLWGPKQGRYLVDSQLKTLSWALGMEAPPRNEPGPFEKTIPAVGERYQSETPIGLGTWAQNADPNYAELDTIALSFLGSDPWLGAPLAHLETADGDPVLRAGGHPVTSDTGAMWLDLVVDPSYEDGLHLPERQFTWTLHLPARQGVDGPVDLAGEYRLRVEIPAADGKIIELMSADFVVGGNR